VLVLIWQQGHGSQTLWSIPATGAIVVYVPLLVFAFLFGLSMDYEVFIVSRIREEYDATGSTDQAVISGIGRTGRLITSAALILFLAFISLSATPETAVKMLATGLGAGILLDALVIRSLLLPALIGVFGRWNWWLPRQLAYALRIEPDRSPVARRRTQPPIAADVQPGSRVEGPTRPPGKRTDLRRDYGARSYGQPGAIGLEHSICRRNAHHSPSRCSRRSAAIEPL
jgi:putative drug exporter of the RND superfamily